VQGLLDYLFQMNMATKGFVLKFDYVAASAEIATVMKIEAGVEIQRSIRVRHLDGTPFSYLTTYVPGDLGRVYTREHLVSQAVLTVLEKTGVQVANAEQTITATLAGARAAESLQVKLGSPLLRIVRVVFDREHRVVEYIIGLYRPDQYQYRTLLSRVSTGDAVSWSGER
jgi:GntR family transcriptional regulator